MNFRLDVGIYEENRRSLIIQGLMKGELGDQVCVKTVGRNHTNCDMCGVTQICTKKVKENVKVLSKTYVNHFRIQVQAY